MLTALICRDGHFRPLPRDQLTAALGEPDALVWVDLEAPTPDEAAVLADVFHFHQLTIDDCLNQRVDPPKVDDYGDYLFLIVQGIDFTAKSEEIRTTELDLYVGRSYVVSFHHRPLPSVTETRERCLRNAPLPARGPDWLAHALIDSLVDHLLPVVEAMNEEVSALEDEALGSPRPDLVQRIATIRRSTLRLRRLMAPQRDLINRLSRGDFQHLIRPETQMYYRDIYDHMLRLEVMVENVRDLGESATNVYLATINNRLNAVMKALSIVGTIFLPLTLLASVFGTNFSPTYESWGWPGFLGMCAFMLGTIAACVWWFRRSGWW